MYRNLWESEVHFCNGRNTVYAIIAEYKLTQHKLTQRRRKQNAFLYKYININITFFKITFWDKIPNKNKVLYVLKTDINLTDIMDNQKYK